MVTLKIFERYDMNIIWVYAPTSECEDEEIELLYEDVENL